MKEQWNDIVCQHSYEWIKEHAAKDNIDISHPYLDKICKQTKSHRITKLILEAYYLGQARAVLMVDNRKDKIVLS